MYKGFFPFTDVSETVEDGREVRGRHFAPLTYYDTKDQRYRTIKITGERSTQLREGYLSAELYYVTNTLRFTLFPKFHYKMFGFIPRYCKHDDLYAGSFARFAIKRLQDTGETITTLSSNWGPSSTNYMQYRLHRKSENDINAAMLTWTGQVIAQQILGFKCISVEEKSDALGERIEAIFGKE